MFLSLQEFLSHLSLPCGVKHREYYRILINGHCFIGKIIYGNDFNSGGLKAIEIDSDQFFQNHLWQFLFSMFYLIDY
jgi:hypothetical protein